jgi:hypothetical protein
LVIAIDKRKRIIIAGVAGASFVLFLVMHPLARSVALSAARARGWQVQSASVRIGLRGVWLRELRAQSALVPELRAYVDAVLLPWSGMLGPKRLTAYGGEIRLPADLQQAQKRLSESPAAARPANAGRWQVRFTGLTATWQSSVKDAHWTAWGISGEASNQASELSVDRVEAGSERWSGVFAQLGAKLKRNAGNWTLENAHALRVNLVKAAGEERAAEPQNAPGVARDSKPEPVKLKPGKPLSKRAPKPDTAAQAEPEAPQRDGIERAVAGLSLLQSHLERWRHTIGRHVAPTATGAIDELNLRWQYGQQKLDIGPLRVQVKHDAQASECVLEQDADVRTARRYLLLRVPNQPSKIEIAADVGAVSLQTLGVKENDLGLLGVAETKLAAALRLSVDELACSAEWEAKGEIVGLGLVQPWLAPRPVEGIQAAFSGKGDLKWKPDFELNVRNLSSSFGKARVEITAQLQRRSNETLASMNLDLPLAACEDLIEALPRGLAPLASQVHLDGTLALQSAVRFDTAHPNAAEVRWKLANACRVKSANPAVSPDRFRAPFILEVPDEHKVYVQRAFGPGTPNWVAFADMSSHLPNAVLVCEDGGFFHHAGFDGQAIRNSIRENLVQGRFARGASTVSMQLAKNLYLRREKTFSRKLQEAVLTLLLEQSFTKNELMELYLNVIELGPGIYGVGEAARVYFNTTAAVLSPLQAFYLVSLLPNPKVMHFEKDGRLSSGWRKLLQHLMTIANKRHYLSDDELKSALQEDLRFGVADTGGGVTEAPLPALEHDAMVDAYDATEH